MSAFTIDIEPTNRCNAKCYFCPRDATPHQGLMSPAVFEQALARCIEFRDSFSTDIHISLCGLGEPLLNRHTPNFVRMVREAGFECSMSSNASLLDEARGQALIDAGLQRIDINVGEEGEDYDEIYKLPYEKTRDNVLRFMEMAGDRCEVQIVLVDHRASPEHLAKMRKYWKAAGVEKFMTFDVINRGGALFVDHMQYETYPELAEARSMIEASGTKPICVAPFMFLFIGYDSQYYLCCSDWRKEAPLGSVFDTSFLAVTKEKLEHVLSREPVCKTCNLDPLNRLTEALRYLPESSDREAKKQALVDDLVKGSNFGMALAEQMAAKAPAAEPREPRKLIPLVVE
jgi:MoaA/NifB/PqqE/SkfB family radical SAM enzyme